MDCRTNFTTRADAVPCAYKMMGTAHSSRESQATKQGKGGEGMQASEGAASRTSSGRGSELAGGGMSTDPDTLTLQTRTHAAGAAACCCGYPAERVEAGQASSFALDLFATALDCQQGGVLQALQGLVRRDAWRRPVENWYAR